jgi:hypothetical protein
MSIIRFFDGTSAWDHSDFPTPLLALPTRETGFVELSLLETAQFRMHVGKNNMKNHLKRIHFVGILAVSLLAGVANAQSSDEFTGLPTYGPNAVYEGLHAGSIWRDAQNSAIERALNPDDYICSAPTSFDLWIGQLIGSIDPVSLDILFNLSAIYWAGDQKALFDNDASDEYIGVEGEYTREQIKRHKDNRRFWDVQTDDILLRACTAP